MHIYVRTSWRHGASVEVMQLQQEQDLQNRSGGLEPRKPLTAKKRHDPGKCILGTLMMIAGVISFFHYVPYPFNLVLAPTLLIVGAATASVRQCSHCRAQVQREAFE